MKILNRGGGQMDLRWLLGLSPLGGMLQYLEDKL